MLTAENHHDQHDGHADSDHAGVVLAALAGILGVVLILGGVLVGHQDDPRSVSAIRCGTLLVIVAVGLGVALGRRRPSSADVDDIADLENVMIGRFTAHEARCVGRHAAHDARCVEGMRGLRDEVAAARAQDR